MSREEFDALIQRLSARAKAAPKRFNTEVGAYAAFGFAYMVGVLVGMAGLTIFLIALIVAAPNALTLKVGIVLGLPSAVVALAIARALWVRLEPPEGLVLRRAEAPELFALVEEMGRKLQTPVFHEVLMRSDYNAAVVQIPRLGIFGWHRNYLLLGLPLLQSLERDEFAAVLAHEFGHLSRSHGRFGNWIYRLRRSWQRVFEELARQKPGKMALPLTQFIGWFWPRFNARAFVLSRANEYEADAAAASAVSATALARALMRLQVDGPLLTERFWPAVYLRANHEASPPGRVFEELREALRQGAEAPDAARWLRIGYKLETDNSDTHPCLKDRLRALGQLSADAEVLAAAPARDGPSAAAVLLGNAEPKVERHLSEVWCTAIASVWQERRTEVDRIHNQLAQLEAVPSDAPPSVDELWTRAQAAMQLESDAAAVPLLDQILSLEPNHAGACFVRGRAFLESDDPGGVELIERAMAQDVGLSEAGCQLLYGFYKRTGQRHRLRPLEERVEGFQALRAAAQQERASVSVGDRFAPPALPANVIAGVAAILAAEPVVARAHLARKVVKYFPDHPCFVLALTLNLPWWKKPTTSAFRQKLVSRVMPKLALPGVFLVFVADKELEALGTCVAETPESLVYTRAN